MKKITAFTLSIITAILLFSSCADVKLASFKDPEYYGKSFKSICVFVDINDYFARKYLENEIVETLRFNGIRSYQGYLFFPPTQKWNDDAIEKVLLEKSFDGYILISQNNRDVSSNITPGSLQTNVINTNRKDKNTGEEIKEQQTITSVKSPQVSYNMASSYRISLIDPTNRKTAWIADATGFINSDNINSADKAIMNRLAKLIVSDLLDKYLLDAQ